MNIRLDFLENLVRFADINTEHLGLKRKFRRKSLSGYLSYQKQRQNQHGFEQSDIKEYKERMICIKQLILSGKLMDMM